jgi:predicted nucleic-acid-binding protein
MRSADTNVIVRLLTRDDPKQLALAEAEAVPGLWISHIVLLETSWVLESSYGRSRKDVADAFEMLLSNAKVMIQDPDVVAGALGEFRAHEAIELSDCLILALARKAGHLPLATFDRKLAKIDGVALLK